MIAFRFAALALVAALGCLPSAFAQDAGLLPAIQNPAIPAHHVTNHRHRDRPVKHHVSDEGAAYQELIARHAAENGLPFALADAVVRIESRYNAKIIHAGNYGLMQIRPQTARGVGFTGASSALLDPDTNLHFGLRYLAAAYKLADGDTCRTLMRYQSGIASKQPNAANRAYCARALDHIAHAKAT